ncbi:ABC transporter ATP-binding protein [Kitasatospora phosalacinea]|uniref:ABC transporter ATP-binding protein n=1 Tax=Kitasatospora phosalacinea TaxID=2065 RepID=UPI0035D88A2B
MTTASTSEHPVLEVGNLRVSVGRGAAEAVREVSFTVRAGQSVGLVGESGSGKTLTCRAVLGLSAPGVEAAADTLALGGTDLLGLDGRGWQRLRGTRLGAVFQDPGSYLNPSLTVGRQLAEPLRVHGGLSRADARRRAVELFDSVGLRDPGAVYDRYPHELSGGMLQRVLIAVAVSGDPDLLVADEATTALDTVVQAEVLDLLARLREERGLGLLLVSHDLAVVADATDRLLVLYAGEVVEDGPTASVVAAPAHPYTEALLAVAGLGDGARTRFPVIPGRPPAPGAAAPGCRFAPRCAYAAPECTLAPVPLTAGPDGRKVRCLLPR